MAETKRNYECPDCLAKLTYEEAQEDACPKCGWIAQELDPADAGCTCALISRFGKHDRFCLFANA